MNHERLLLKLQHVGASPAAKAWMLSYLSNRYQAVRVNTSLSKPLQVQLLYTKSMIRFCSKDQADVAANINSALQRFQDWCLETDQLLLNPKLLKTKLLLFGSHPMSEHMGKRLTPSHAAKDLGVFLDSNWTFNKH